MNIIHSKKAPPKIKIDAKNQTSKKWEIVKHYIGRAVTMTDPTNKNYTPQFHLCQ